VIPYVPLLQSLSTSRCVVLSSVLFRLISNFAELPAEEGSTLSLIVAVSLLSSSILGDETSLKRDDARMRSAKVTGYVGMATRSDEYGGAIRYVLYVIHLGPRTEGRDETTNNKRVSPISSTSSQQPAVNCNHSSTVRREVDIAVAL
jgi:hypothetical protein